MHDDVLHAISEELLKAVEEKDVEGVTECLKSFATCLQQYDEEQDQEMGDQD